MSGRRTLSPLGSMSYLRGLALKILPPKTTKILIKILIFFIFLLKTYIAGTRQNHLSEAILMSTRIYALSRNKKNNVYPCKPQFYYIKMGFKGVSVT